MTASDPGMYDSAAAKASALLYEVQALLDDDDATFEVVYHSLSGRLGPAGDAAVDEARRLAGEVERATQRREVWVELDKTNQRRIDRAEQRAEQAEAERDAERAKVERVEALCADAERLNAGSLMSGDVRAALADPARDGEPSVPTPICSRHDRALTFRPTDWSAWQICAKCGAVVRDEAKPC